MNPNHSPSFSFDINLDIFHSTLQSSRSSLPFSFSDWAFCCRRDCLVTNLNLLSPSHEWCGLKCHITLNLRCTSLLKGELAVKNTFASRYVSLSIKFTNILAKPLVLQGKSCFRDFSKRRKLYLEFKTHPNFQFKKKCEK